MHEILLKNGYFYKKDKTSQKYKVLQNNNGDMLIISKNQESGDYLYFNSHNDSDKGNIFSFCKNRGIYVKDLLNDEIEIENLKN